MSQTAASHAARVAQRPTSERSDAWRGAAPRRVRPAVPPRSLRPPPYGIAMLDERAPEELTLTPIQRRAKTAGVSGLGAPPAPPSDPGVSQAPGRRAPLAGGRAVQARAGSMSGPDVAATADRGVSGASAELPHREVIQRSFGRHDLGGVRARVGGEAAEASRALGAEAYATGDRVAFASAPDLRTAAHEAAHVVQQAGGVQLEDGVGQAGDRYEQHADAVADAVVAGHSAEALLDAFAARGTGAAAGAATQRQVVQRKLDPRYSGYYAIKAMSLSQFDEHARAQADWAVSIQFAWNRCHLHDLLAFARKDDGLALGACGVFKVSALLAQKVGQGAPVDQDLTDYSRAASADRNAGTIHIEEPAATVKQAATWGAALRKLEVGIGGPIIKRAIPQNRSAPSLGWLVDKGAVDELVAYFQKVQPLLDADNGAEIHSYLSFRKEKGPAKLAGYQEHLTEIRDYHRFTVEQLDLLVANTRTAESNRSGKSEPLPISVVLQSAFDHNGAFHRDPYMTEVLKRTNRITLVAEGKRSLAEFGAALTRFAAYGEVDKVDEIMLAGHGNAKLMGLAGTREARLSEVPATYAAVKESVTSASTDLIETIKAVLRADPSSRVVLNACLTASNSVAKNLVLDPDPDTAALQIKGAIAVDPSLATAIQALVGTDRGAVRGANASFGQVSLLDLEGRIDIVSKTDPMLTATKLLYAEQGAEPTGVLRATLESWADDRAATIVAVQKHIGATKDATAWRERVIHVLLSLIVNDENNGSLIRDLTFTAGALGHLDSRQTCRVKNLRGRVPPEHMNHIFTYMTGANEWKDVRTNYIPVVVYQVWLKKDADKVGDFLGYLNSSTFDTQNVAAFLDLAHLKPNIADLLPAPPTPNTPPRGAFLIALRYLIQERDAAPQESKVYIRDVVGEGNQRFPVTANVRVILKGATQQRVLEAAGVVPPSGTAPPTAPAPNLAPTGRGPNTLYVEPVTQRGKLTSTTTAYMLPTGTVIGQITVGAGKEKTLDIIGNTKARIGDEDDVGLVAVHYKIGNNRTVFVRDSAITRID